MCVSSCETTHQQKAPFNRNKAEEGSYINSFSQKDKVKERETPELSNLFSVS